MADADESVLPKGGEVFASTRSYATLTFGWHQTLDSVTATVSKIVKDALPSDVRGSADLTDTVGACCSMFAQLIAAQAAEYAAADSKNTILPEHVTKAVEALGFPHYLPTLETALEEVKSTRTGAIKSKRSVADDKGMSEEEQIRLQQEMLAAARNFSSP